MKNLFIYTNPEKKFSEETDDLIKIQIDNSLDLGWKREDILLFTNFDYGYNGVGSIEIPLLGHGWDRTNKLPAIVYLYDNRLIDNGLHWYHDLDAYQNELLGELPDNRLLLTGYGYKAQINAGSFFFRDARDIISYWNKRASQIVRTRSDEKTMTDMIRNGEMTDYEELNITYNFGQRCPKLCYEKADKPLRVLHFHPYYRFYPKDDTNINVFMHGHNKHKIPMMNERLIKIFQDHNVT